VWAVDRNDRGQPISADRFFSVGGISTVGDFDRRRFRLPKPAVGKRSTSDPRRSRPLNKNNICNFGRPFFHGRSVHGRSKKLFFFGGRPTEIWLDRDFGRPGRGRVPTLLLTDFLSNYEIF
jgi:hypothetical protein